eukprot:5890251-Pyramimonas_sp.AAC.1
MWTQFQTRGGIANAELSLDCCLATVDGYTQTLYVASDSYIARAACATSRTSGRGPTLPRAR